MKRKGWMFSSLTDLNGFRGKIFLCQKFNRYTRVCERFKLNKDSIYHRKVTYYDCSQTINWKFHSNADGEKERPYQLTYVHISRISTLDNIHRKSLEYRSFIYVYILLYINWKYFPIHRLHKCLIWLYRRITSLMWSILLGENSFPLEHSFGTFKLSVK